MNRMKIKYIFLLFILAGIIIINTCCADAETQPFTSINPQNLYRSIFFPYIGLLNPGANGATGGYSDFYPDKTQLEDLSHERVEDTMALRDAAALLDINLEKAGEISQRLKFEIQKLQERGENVTRLQELSGEYIRLIDEAKHYRELADSASRGENVNMTQREYLVSSQKSMIQANIVLKEIFDELQSFMPGTEQLNESFQLSAEGKGRVILVGSFALNAHLENGVMVIMDSPSTSVIYLKGNYTFEEQKEGPRTVLLYNIRSADIKIPSSFKTVLLYAENISLTATEGEGTVTFFGNGTYAIEEANGTKKDESWSSIAFEITSPARDAEVQKFDQPMDVRTGIYIHGHGKT